MSPSLDATLDRTTIGDATTVLAISAQPFGEGVIFERNCRDYQNT
jgi:hypothetical protein